MSDMLSKILNTSIPPDYKSPLRPELPSKEDLDSVKANVKMYIEDFKKGIIGPVQTPHGNKDTTNFAPKKAEESPHGKLVKEGKLVEAGAVVEGLPRVVGAEVLFVSDKALQAIKVTMRWKLEDGTFLIQASGRMHAIEEMKSIEIDFTKEGDDGELIAYVRKKNEDTSGT